MKVYNNYNNKLSHYYDMFRPVQIIFRVYSKLKVVFGAGELLLLCCGV
jgi:hypothetical protein